MDMTLTPMSDTASEAGSYGTVDAYIQRQLDRLHAPGAAVAIVEGDQVVHQRGFGHAQRNGTSATPQTPFVLGSLTKSFTALAVMQLVEAGKIKLDAPVQRYLPWFCVADGQASREMTVRHLLNQSSGLDSWSGWVPMADFDPSPGAAENHARALAKLRLTRPVGSAFEYSNANYDLLGLIVEAASGESYPEYVQNHIFGPLDMRHSYTTREEAMQNGLAMGHRYWFGYPVAAPETRSPRGSLASGELISTTEDMSHYLIAQLNEGRYGDAQILSPAGIDEMHRAAVVVDTMGLSSSAEHYGMGWFVEEDGPIVWHDGMVPDFWTYMALVPEQRKAIVLLVNVDHAATKFAFDEIGAGAAALVAGAQPKPSRFGFTLWALRGLLLIPILQALGVTTTLLLLRRWRLHPGTRPSGRRKWLLYIGLPIIPNLLIALGAVVSFARGRAGFLFLFAPDFSWTFLIGGSFAGIWTLLRTWLTLRTLRERK
jgi:CubicO group peptidase (beta-lactamase class C family)